MTTTNEMYRVTATLAIPITVGNSWSGTETTTGIRYNAVTKYEYKDNCLIITDKHCGEVILSLTHYSSIQITKRQ